MLAVSILALWASHRVLELDPSPAILMGVAMVATLLESLPLRSAYEESTVPFFTALLLWLTYGGTLLSTTW